MTEFIKSFNLQKEQGYRLSDDHTLMKKQTLLLKSGGGIKAEPASVFQPHCMRKLLLIKGTFISLR